MESRAEQDLSVPAGVVPGSGAVSQTRALERLFAFQQELARARGSVVAVARAAVDHALHISGADAAIFEWIEGEELVTRAVEGSTSYAVGHRISILDSPCLPCIRDVEPVVCRDLGTDLLKHGVFRRDGTHSFLALPVVYDGRVLGVLSLLWRRPNGFDDAVEQTMRTLGGMCGLAAGVIYQSSRRRQAEEAVRRGELRFQVLTRATNDALWEWDLSTNQMWWSESMHKLFGYSAADIGTDAEWFFGSIHADDRERVRSAIQGVLDHGDELWIGEYRFARGDRGYAYVLDRGYVLYDDDRKPVRIVGSMLDITYRKRSEQKLRTLASELARSNRELQDFTSVASHDLQEPLIKVRMFADRLQKELGSQLDDKCADYLERIINGTTRMRTLIDDLLSLSRVTTKAQPFSSVALGDIAQEVVSDLEARIEHTGGQVIITPLPVIEADASQMRQLIQNLVGNALKYHRSGVPPVVKVFARVFSERRQLADTVSSSASLCQLFVMDNGIGFDEKYIDRIFAPFQRLVSRSSYEGSGMGLAICRKIVERHGGRMTARSVEGEGSTFIVTMPMKQRTVDAASQSGIPS